jgi:hypothetical protein
MQQLKIGSTVQMKGYFWSRLRFLLQRCLGDCKADPPGLFVVVDIRSNGAAVIEPAFVCDTCGRALPWSFGAADERPMSCDDCYVNTGGEW